jgi:hypothetical protein
MHIKKYNQVHAYNCIYNHDIFILYIIIYIYIYYIQCIYVRITIGHQNSCLATQE